MQRWRVLRWAGAVVLAAGCGVGVDTAPSPATKAAAPPPRPVPDGMLYGTEVYFHMRSLPAGVAQGAAWSRYYDGRAVAGDGRVTQRQDMDMMGVWRVRLFLDVDGDERADVALNYLNAPLEWFAGVDEGAGVWYEGTLTTWDREFSRVGVKGDVLDNPFGGWGGG